MKQVSVLILKRHFEIKWNCMPIHFAWINEKYLSENIAKMVCVSWYEPYHQKCQKAQENSLPREKNPINFGYDIYFMTIPEKERNVLHNQDTSELIKLLNHLI